MFRTAIVTSLATMTLAAPVAATGVCGDPVRFWQDQMIGSIALPPDLAGHPYARHRRDRRGRGARQAVPRRLWRTLSGTPSSLPGRWAPTPDEMIPAQLNSSAAPSHG